MSKRRRRPGVRTIQVLAVLLAAVLVPAAAAAAQQVPAAQEPTASEQPPAPAAPAAKPCSGPEHRQFDFWIGDWEVTQPDGSPAGSNRIEAILGGCVLQERWQGAGGSRGESYNLYSQRDGRWHQTWVDNSGTLLLLDGGLEDGKMVLSGRRTGPDGEPALHQISWELLADGRVRQHWRVSNDDGESWRDLFIGLYARRP